MNVPTISFSINKTITSTTTSNQSSISSPHIVFGSQTISNETKLKIGTVLVTLKSADLINNISHMNTIEIRYIMNKLFPIRSGYNKQFNEHYSYRLVYFDWNINSEAYALHKQYNDFPDPSYHWVYPLGNEPKEKHVLFGTYYIQHKLWEHQFPSNCEDKKFLIVAVWNGGIGNIIRVLTRTLATALNSNRILIAEPLYWKLWGDEEFCKGQSQSILCYLEPFTNCKVDKSDIEKAFNHNVPFVGSNYIHASNYNELLKHPSAKYAFFRQMGFEGAPSMIGSFLSKTKSHHDPLWYWRIQGATFITRLNKRTLNWVHEYEKEKCRYCQNEYDISLYIRHGDKWKEMKLINAEIYRKAIEILVKADDKRNYTIYVNGDDQESIDIIHSLPYSVISYNNSRKNLDMRLLNQQKHIGLISFADLYQQVRAEHCIGTMASNWNRLIYQLKMTLGMKSDGYIIEVGNEPCISYSHCKLLGKQQNTYHG